MNARLLNAVAELEASQIIDPEGFEHGYVVEEIREDSRDSGESFYSTLAEAKRIFDGLKLSSEHDRVAIYEGEFCGRWSQFDDRIESRGAVTLIAERVADPKEVVWFQAEYDAWTRRVEISNAAYWQKLDWLRGLTPAPSWA